MTSLFFPVLTFPVLLAAVNITACKTALYFLVTNEDITWKQIDNTFKGLSFIHISSYPYVQWLQVFVCLGVLESVVFCSITLIL